MYVHCPKKNRKSLDLKPHGYTFIELLIAIVIMAIVFTTGSISYRGYMRKQVMDTAVRQLESDLKLAKEMALSGRAMPICDANGGVLGYGLMFNNQHWNNNFTVDYNIGVLCAYGNFCTLNGAGLAYCTHTGKSLNQKIRMEHTGANAVDEFIFYIMGKGFSHGISLTAVPSSATLTLTHKDTSGPTLLQRTISVSESGLITVN